MMGRGPLSKRPDGRFNFEPPGAALLSHPRRTASGAGGGEAADAVVALTPEGQTPDVAVEGTAGRAVSGV